MKTIPFLALFALLILTSSYVSSVIKTPQHQGVIKSEFNHFPIDRNEGNVALSLPVNAPDISPFYIGRTMSGSYSKSIHQVESTIQSADERVYVVKRK